MNEIAIINLCIINNIHTNNLYIIKYVNIYVFNLKNKKYYLLPAASLA